MRSLQFVEKRLEAAYLSEDDEFTTVARVLFYVSAFLSCLALIMTLVIRSSGLERPIIGVLFAVFVVISAMVLYGRARQASLALSFVLSVVLSSLVFTNPNCNGYLEYYLIGFMNMFAMGLTILVGFYKWQVFPIAGISILAVVLNAFLRVIPWARETGGSPQFDDVAIVSVLSLCVAFSLWGVFSRTTRFNRLAKESGAKSDRQVGILRGAMEASGDALSRGDQLSSSAARTKDLSSQALALADTAGNSMREVLNDSRKLGGELDGISSNSRTVRTSTEAQSSVINQTSAAVEEMTASIHNIAGVTRERREAVNELTHSTEEGQQVVSHSSESMKKVESSTGAILDIVKVISAVAAQTNLLAMNAAIEAAHAGTYGQGFAVVADEIRKLSEQTSKSVRAVNDTVKATISDIRIASDGNLRAVQSFASIAREASLVSGAMDEIINGLDELSRGTEEINRGVADSVSSTNELRTAVASLDVQIDKARESLVALSHAAERVEGELSEVRGNVQSIASEAGQVEEIGKLNSEGLSAIKKALDRAGL